MKFAVIAAGQGSRLVAEGVEVSKLLLRIKGERMIERLFRNSIVEYKDRYKDGR
ncbi:hypothetical protein EZS27_025164 [termite gut metagenome]|uniref:2-C-methyl-D-erythritol 4-phosphate cytidylyltransferase n=1 Tax=termite gut metagenome TaxID=433724 RepID=A0A5J4QWS4_9ZZZZ